MSSDNNIYYKLIASCTWKSTLVRESYPRLTDNQPPSSCLLRLCRNKSQSCVVELLLENNARTTKKSSLNSTCGRICIIQMQMLQSWAGIGLVTSHLDITLLLLKTGLISCGTFLEVQVRFVVEVILSMSLWMPQCLPYWESWLTCQTPPCNQKPHLRLIHGCWDHKKMLGGGEKMIIKLARTFCYSKHACFTDWISFSCHWCPAIHNSLQSISFTLPWSWSRPFHQDPIGLYFNHFIKPLNCPWFLSRNRMRMEHL